MQNPNDPVNNILVLLPLFLHIYAQNSHCMGNVGSGKYYCIHQTANKFAHMELMTCIIHVPMSLDTTLQINLHLILELGLW